MTTKDEIARRKLSLLELARSFQIEGSSFRRPTTSTHTHPEKNDKGGRGCGPERKSGEGRSSRHFGGSCINSTSTPSCARK